MKKKSLATLLSGFLTVALTGVGFASWIITGGSTASYTEGSVTAEAVEDRRVKITDLSVSNGEIIFGNEATPSTSNTKPWFKIGTSKTSNLEATISFKVKNAKTYGESVSFNFAVDAGHQTAYTTATSKNYITAPTLNPITDFDSDDQTITVNLTFAWGSYFGGKDPYTYFNNTFTDASVDVDSSENFKSAGDEAYDVMSAINALNGATYTITITATAAE